MENVVEDILAAEAPVAIRRKQFGFRHTYKQFTFVSYRSVMRTPRGAKMRYRGMLLERVIHAPGRSIAAPVTANWKLELHVAGALQHVDDGTAVNFEKSRILGHTCGYASRLMPLPKRPYSSALRSPISSRSSLNFSSRAVTSSLILSTEAERRSCTSGSGNE